MVKSSGVYLQTPLDRIGLSSQASGRSNIIENMVSALTAQKAFLNNCENIVNHRVDIQEDTKQH